MFYILEAVEKQRGIVSLADDWESMILKFCTIKNEIFQEEKVFWKFSYNEV